MQRCPPEPAWWRRGGLLGPLALAGLSLLFLYRPILRFGDAYFSSADFAQAYSLTQVEPGHVAGNSLLSDPPTQMQPWLMFAREELRAGRLPLWNPQNGAGAPLFANYQSGLLSPFNLPFYFLDLRVALIASAFFKQYALALFTWLFLRLVGLSTWPSLLGALAFALCGHNVLLLSYPHAGAAVVLPAGLYFVELIAQRSARAWSVHERGAGGRPTRARLHWPLCGLALSLAAGCLAGQPEPFCFGLLLVVLYALARLFELWRVRAARLRVLLVLTGKLGFASAIAAALCAPQVLTFQEYLVRSHVLEERSASQTPLSLHLWPLALFPNALGNPGEGVVLTHEIPPPNYELANMGHVGGAALLLVLLALGFAHRDKRLAFFLVVAGVWAVYAYDLFGSAALFGALPGLGTLPINRSQSVWAFSLACAAALALQHLLEGTARRASSSRCFVTWGMGALCIGACAARAWSLSREYAERTPHEPYFEQYVSRHLVLESGACALAVAAAGLLWWLRAPRLRTACCAALVLALYAQTAGLWRKYNPLCPEELHYPVTPSIRTLQEEVGDARLLVLGEDTLPPDINLAYGLRLAGHYDGMWMRRVDMLYRELYGKGSNWREALRASRLGLDLFGVEYVLARWDWLPIESGLGRVDWNASRVPLEQVEVLPQVPVSQVFSARQNGLSSVAVWLSAAGGEVPHRLHLRLTEIHSGRVVVEHTLAGGALRERMPAIPANLDPRGALPGRWMAHSFPEIGDSRGRRYELRLSSPDARAGSAVSAWLTRRQLEGAGALHIAGASVPGTLVHDFAFHGGGFEPVANLSQHTLYRYARAAGRYRTVGRASTAASDYEAFQLMQSAGFDAREQVVLESGAAADFAPGSAEPVHVLLEEPCHVILSAARSTPGWLVSSSAWYPGWKARVNGLEQPLLRADIAFCAVELQAGLNEVELVYEPAVLRQGVWIACAAAALGLLALMLAVRSP